VLHAVSAKINTTYVETQVANILELHSRRLAESELSVPMWDAPKATTRSFGTYRVSLESADT